MLVFWDIDGTLLYCGSDGTKALNGAFFDLYGIRDAFVGAGIGRGMDRTILERIMAAHHIDFSDFEKIHSAFVAKLECVLREDPDKCVLPGVKTLLECISKNGGTNALLTSNLRAGAECKLKIMKLLHDGTGKKLFAGGGYGDISREKWEAAQSALSEINQQTEPSFKTDHCLIIGDSIYDIETARHFGCGVIAVATGWTPAKELAAASPDAFFTDLSDVETVFSEICRLTQRARSNANA